MKLTFNMFPVENLADAVACYRAIGFSEVWRPDDVTVLLGGTGPEAVDIMMEDDPTERRIGSGPVFRVSSVDDFADTRTDLSWLLHPCDTPVGRYAIFQDPLANPIRLLDLTYDDGTFARLMRDRHAPDPNTR